MSAGVTTINLDPVQTIDEVIGNREGSSARISSLNLAAMLAGSGALADKINLLEAQITSGTVAVANWSVLKQITPAQDGTGGEVLDTDAGDHPRATASGYNGTLEPNAGRYSWNAAWGRWVRIGATGLSQTATQAQLTALESRLVQDIQSLNDGLRLQGAWNASGSFPAGATRGDFYLVSDAGSVDDQQFNVGDWLVAVSATPATATFAGSWIRAAYGAPSVSSYDTIADFVAADLTALPAGRTIQVKGRDWIKVPGAAHFAKSDWEPVIFDTVDDLKMSIRTMTVGDEIEAEGYRYNVEPAVFATPHILTAGAARLSVKGERVNVIAFGADPSGIRESSAEWNIATKWCVATGRMGESQGTFYCLNSISPGGLLRWDFGSETLLQWKSIDTDDLIEVLHCPQGETEVSGSGVFCLWDTSGMKDSTLDGQLVISGSLVGSMPLAVRKNILSNVAGVSAATTSSAEMRWDKLHVRGCGFGLYAANFAGSAPPVLGFTRWTVNDLQFSFNLAWLRTSPGGNQTDEFKAHNVHVTRCGGQNSVVRGTEFVADHVLLKGFDDVQDLEPGTVSTTAGSTIVNLSADNPDLVEGMTICIEDASNSLDTPGQRNWLVADIVAKTGTQLTLERAAENTVAAAGYIVNPMDTLVIAGGWHVTRTYFENVLGYGLLVQNSAWMFGSTKASNGVLGSRYDSPVIARPEVGKSCTIEIVSEGTNRGNANMKSLVAFQPLRQGDVNNAASIKVKAVGARAEYGVTSAVIRVIETVGAPVAQVGLTSNHLNHTEGGTLLVEYDDISEYLQPIDGSRQAYGFGKMGSARVLDTKSITDGTAVNAFSDTAGGSSVKTAASPGYIWFPVTPSSRIRLSGRIPSGTFIAPDARFYAENTFIGTDRTLTRTTGRFTAYLDVPAGADRMRFFANTSDDFTIDELYVDTIQIL